MSDEETDLAVRAQAGDQKAFESLYAASAGRVRAYLLRSGFAGGDADDLLQETFYRAYASLGTFDSARGGFAGWLAAIARNIARKSWSRRSRAEHFDSDLAEQVLADGDGPGESAGTREEIDILHACVDSLPMELGMIVRLRYVEGRTTRGIAEAAGIPEATVRLRLAEAQSMLEEYLRTKGVIQ